MVPDRNSCTTATVAAAWPSSRVVINNNKRKMYTNKLARVYNNILQPNILYPVWDQTESGGRYRVTVRQHNAHKHSMYAA